MRFAYHPQAGESELVIEGEAFAHLFKARRHREGEQLTFRTLLDQRLFVYSIETLDRRRAALRLVSSREEPM